MTRYAPGAGRNLLALALLLAAVLVPALLPAGAGPRDDPWHGWAEDTTFTITQVRPGVYFATVRPGRIVGANASFIVTDRDVILVDDHITPRAARALRAEIARITPQPLRYVINTHFHYDHTSGNMIFGPEVEILSHPYTRARLIATGQASITEQLAAARAAVTALRARRDTTRNDSLRRDLTQRIAAQEQLAADYSGLVVALPTLTLDSSIALHRGGGQEIRVFYMGRGHTAGDIVVQLPRESLLIAGDLMTNTAGPPNMMDAFAGDWGATLRRLAGLSFTTTLPGHGTAFDGKDRYGQIADFMDDIWRQTTTLARAGVPRDSLARRLDVARWTTLFPALRPNGLNPVFAGRAWDVAMGREN